MSSYEQVSRGALVTNTLLAQVGRFLADPAAQDFEPQAGRNELHLSIHGLLSFCSLIEACVLNDQLLTLEGRLSPRSQAVLEHPLLTTLAEAGVLHLGSVRFDADELYRDIQSIIGPERLGKPLITARYSALYWEKLLPEMVSSTPGDTMVEDPLIADTWFMRVVAQPHARKLLLTALDAVQLIREQSFGDLISGTGEAETASHILRTFLYQTAAGANQLALVPDYTRGPIIAGLNRYLRAEASSVMTRAQQLLHSQVSPDIDRLLALQRPLGVPLPPFTAILLSRISSENDIPDELFRIRDEYKNLRAGLTQFDRSFAEATTIGEIVQARMKAERSFGAIVETLQQKQRRTILDRTLNSVEIVSAGVDLASNPMSAPQSALLRPLKLFQRWWQRRPLVQIFDVIDELRSIRYYNELAPRIFGLDIDLEGALEFRRSQFALQQMLWESQNPAVTNATESEEGLEKK